MSFTLYLVFKKTVIIIIKELLFSFLKTICLNNEKIKFYFLRNTKDIFDKFIKIEYIESPAEKEYEKDILQINKHFKIKKENLFQFSDLWKITTPLHLACEGGHYNIVSCILSKKEYAQKQVFEVDSERRTPLIVVCQNGFLECVKLLVNFGVLSKSFQSGLIDAAS